MMARLFFIVMLLVGAGRGYAQSFPMIPVFSETDQEHTDKALSALVMTTDDARFEKNIGQPKWTLSWVTNTLNDPWLLPGFAEKIYTAAEHTNVQGLWTLAAECLEIDPQPGSFSTQQVSQAAGFAVSGLSTSLSNALSHFIREANIARALCDQAYVEVGPSDRVYLAASILSPAFDTEMKTEVRDVLAAAGIPRFVQERVEVESEQLDGTASSLAWLELINRIDLKKIHQSGMHFFQAVSNLMNLASHEDVWPEDVVTVHTPFGAVMIGTKRADTYAQPALLILDPGGNDVYMDDAGAANGITTNYLAAIIDLDGDDRYTSKKLLGAGAALFGNAVVIDRVGDDQYDAGYAGCGAALFGSAWVEDQAGDDQYHGYAICQGAASVGFAMLIDQSGRDRYDAGFYGQGFSGVKGWGLLLDRSGNDTYNAGNRMRDSDRNVDRYLSLSQGFSIGMRPHAGGGVAALIDLAGNDTYTADVFGQGVGYYYSAGFLLDGSGNDRYSVYQYGQGCGIHLSLGLLADASGDDIYSGYILSQGAAHDYAVGMLFDHEGDDTYTADHHAQGRALNNAFALLVDRAGNDAYFGRQREQTQGVGNEGGFRDYGSLALLLDLGGKDVYSGGFSNRTITLRPLYGAVYDHEEDENE